MGWAEDKLAGRNQDSSANLADFADRYFKIGLKPDFKEESEFKNKAFFFFFLSEQSLKLYLIWSSEVFYDTNFTLKSRF